MKVYLKIVIVLFAILLGYVESSDKRRNIKEASRWFSSADSAN